MTRQRLNLRQHQPFKVKIDPLLFNEVYLQMYNKTTPLQIAVGSSGSGKSKAISQLIVLYALEGRACLVGRQTLNSIRKSVWKEIVKTISDFKLNDYFYIKISDFEIVSKISKGSIQFVGLQDVERLKSIVPTKDNGFSVGWLEEASEVNKDAFTQFRIRMRGRTQHPKITILSLNPTDKNCFIYKDYFEDKTLEQQGLYEDDEVFILRTTYKDNRFLDSSEIKMLEALQHKSPYHFMVYAEGLWANIGDRIINNVVSEPVVYNPSLPVYIGIDNGVTDPQVVVFCHIINDAIYIFDAIHKTDMSNDAIVESIKIKLALYNLNNPLILMDSNEPRLTKYLKSKGLNCKSAKKGAGSVLVGISWMMTKTFHVHNTLNDIYLDLTNYCWSKDKAGNVIQKPDHKHSDGVDAIRYAFNTKYSGSGGLSFRHT